MSKKDVKNLSMASASPLQTLWTWVGSYGKLDECLVCACSNSSKCIVEIPLRCTIDVRVPQGSCHVDQHAGDVDELAPDFHRGRYPENVDEAEEKIVQRRTAVHIIQGNICFDRYLRPGRTQVVLAKGHDTGIKRCQEQ